MRDPAPLVVFPPIATTAEALELLQLESLNDSISGLYIHTHPDRHEASGFSWRGIAEDAIRELSVLGVSEAHFVGIGIGAYVLAELVRHHPDRIRSLVFVASSPADVPDEWRDRDRDTGSSVKGSMDGVVEPTVARWFTSTAVEADEAGVRIARSALRAMEPAVWSDIWEAIATRTTLDDAELSAIRVPVTAVAPLHDPSPNAGRLRRLSEIVPLGRLVYIDGAHMAHLERPGSVRTAIDSHLAWVAAHPARVQPVYWAGE